MFFGAPSSDYTADSAFEAIAEMISYTNNGKLMIMRVPVGLRGWIPELFEARRLRPACFMHASDAIKI